MKPTLTAMSMMKVVLAAKQEKCFFCALKTKLLWKKYAGTRVESFIMLFDPKYLLHVSTTHGLSPDMLEAIFTKIGGVK